MIRVLVADDHLPMRKAIQALLRRTEDIEVVGEASDGGEALAKVKQLTPDVLVMDILMPEMDGIEATGKIVTEDSTVAVLLVSMFRDPYLIERAIVKGARGYVHKSALAEELIPAIRSVSEGNTHFPGK